MGLFLQITLFPGGDILNCQKALQQCSDDSQLSVQIDECHWSQYPKGSAVLLNNDCCGYEALADKLSSLLDTPVMVLYIYDGDYWGYFLWKDGTREDQFASLANYFREGEPPETPGDAQKVSQYFNVKPEDIDRYLIPWLEEETNRYAYKNDSAVIGDCWQMADFMKALGFDYDQLCLPEAEPESVPTAAPVTEKESWKPYIYNNAKPIDTPVLPNALTDRKYALKWAKKLGAEHIEVIQVLQSKKYKSAVPLLTEAIRTEPNNPALYLLRAFCWNQLEGLNHGMSRKPDMDRDLTKFLEFEPDDIMALRARCPTAATTSRYQRHILDLTKLIELDPENIDLYQLDRAYRYHWVGDDNAARRDLESILQREELWTVDLVYLCREFRMSGF